MPVTGKIAALHYRIEPRPGSVSRPVDVTYSGDYLARRGYVASGAGSVTLPIFGLYADYRNVVDIEVTLQDGSQQTVQTTISTASYSDPNGIYDKPSVLVPRKAGDGLDFSFFYMKSALGSPVVVDTDGQVRWVAPGMGNSTSSIFQNNGFVIGSPESLSVQRLELDGTSTGYQLNAAGLTSFHHNIDPGKQGVLGELNADANGASLLETTLAEFDPASGTVIKTWEMGDILARYMQSHGDDPTKFVRPGVDWFHMNAAAYDAKDNAIIVSSRENFVMKIDYNTGDLIWILGDPTKYWHSFPSLAARSLVMASSGLAPIGQHAVSITPDGLLLLFNDGLRSVNQPAGAPAGQSRTYSAVSAYAIDAASLSASEALHFDYGQSIYADICSSAYKSPAGASMLVNFATADNDTHARLVGLDSNQQVAFDFQYNTSGCNTSWNAQPIPFEAMQFQ